MGGRGIVTVETPANELLSMPHVTMRRSEELAIVPVLTRFQLLVLPLTVS